MSSSSSALRELQRDLENKANDLSKLQKGKLIKTYAQHLISLLFVLKIFDWKTLTWSFYLCIFC